MHTRYIFIYGFLEFDISFDRLANSIQTIMRRNAKSLDQEAFPMKSDKALHWSESRRQYSKALFRIFYVSSPIRKLLAVLFSTVLFVLLLELLGRFRMQYELYSTDSVGRDRLGFLNEMSIDLSSSFVKDQRKGHKFISATTNTQLTELIKKRRKKTNGRKVLIGCSAHWEEYVLHSFLYLFTELKEKYGWVELVDSDIDHLLADKSTPSVLFFCLNSFTDPFLAFVERSDKFAEMRSRGTLIVLWNDDMRYYDQYDPIILREKIFKCADVLVGTYTFLLNTYFASVTSNMQLVDMPVTLWLPHSASSDFIGGPLNTHPIRKILLAGARGSNWYPLRHWFGQYQHQNGQVMDILPHSGYHVTDNQSQIFASYLRSYHVGITTTMLLQYVVAKVFEIPATGSLLLLNRDLAPMLESLGFRDRDNYVAYDSNDPVKSIWWVSDPKNFEQIDQIRAKGMETVRENHLVSHRAQALNAFFVNGSVTYTFPVEFDVKSPCPMMCYSSKSACEQKFASYGLYKCDYNFCGIKSLLH
uniref:Uncharacterized protein AlNc14C114G6463 n=1 Tax=Albugo laibachii Nc14 TaxID=890382 RepID=F0WIS8_9STRA|nr:conserved hypothetical protein [Albugo laibachii Nc14]|eukprot:CCA21172.1 conserved hypothetical protein [Albugo laibachii Nc14]